jgi:uncharacterized membrane protein HdeD (DUF308 family)
MDLLSNPSHSWPFILFRAATAVLFGLVALLMPVPTLAVLVLLFAAYMVTDGIFAALAGIRAARKHERWGWFAVEAVANIAAGVIAFLWPGITVFVFVAITAAWALISGGVMLYGALRFQQRHGRIWLALAGLVSVLWGVLLIMFPIAGAVVMTLWLGAYALIFGVALLFLALRLRREAKMRPPEQSSSSSSSSGAPPAGA